MSWFSEQLSGIAGKAENFLNKIDQKTANVLNHSSNDLIPNKINDDNEFIIHNEFIHNQTESGASLPNSQSLPQLKSIFVSSDPESEFGKNEFRYGHSRDSSVASYHGLSMKDTSNLSKNKFISKPTKPIEDGQLFGYLNNKQGDLPNYGQTSSLNTEGRHDRTRSSDESIRLNSSRSNERNGSPISQPYASNDFTASSNHQQQSILLNGEPIEQPVNSNAVRQKQSEALKSMLREEKQKLNELKTEYKRHTESLNSEISFLKDRLDQHLAKQDVRSEADNLRQQLKLERANKEKFEKEISVLSTSFSSLKAEFEEYKVRAQRTLQSKDELIDQLQQQQSNDGNQALDRKLDELQHLESANQQLQQELEEIKFKYSKLKQETDELTDGKINALESQLKQSQYELNNVRTLNERLEAESKSLQIELDQSKSYLSRVKQEQTIELQARQRQIDELNSELVSLKESNHKWSQQGIPQDLELKIKNLTENLLSKQTLVEHLKREKNSLVLQLEESNRQMANYTKQQNKASNYYINFKDGLSERSPSLGGADGSFDNAPVARRVRKAYSQLDQFRWVFDRNDDGSNCLRVLCASSISNRLTLPSN